MRKLTIIFLILISLFSTSSLYSQWYEQTLPFNATIYDMIFFDANTGLISFNNKQVIRTSDGGNSWTAVFNGILFSLKKVDSTSVFAHGGRLGHDLIYKTTDKGITWDSSGETSLIMSDIWFANRDTGWIPLGGTGSQNGIYKTTNGGATVTKISSDIAGGMITFLPKKYNGEYFGWDVQQQGLYITTNSGVNWVKSLGLDSLNLGSGTFINKDTGWVSGVTNFSKYRIMFTSNGGINWIKQLEDELGITQIKFISSNRGWAGKWDNKIFATSNSGITWGFQNLPSYNPISHIYMLDSLTGWCVGSKLLHTTNGGGNIVAIKNITGINPTEYILKQNYPNPFNPTSIIEFSIKDKAIVSLIIYDIQGKEIEKLFSNKELISGDYKSIVYFSDKNLSSGIYFYKLIVQGKEDIVLTKKMSFVK